MSPPTKLDKRVVNSYRKRNKFPIVYTAQFHYCVGGSMPPPYNSSVFSALNNHLFWHSGDFGHGGGEGIAGGDAGRTGAAEQTTAEVRLAGRSI